MAQAFDPKTFDWTVYQLKKYKYWILSLHRNQKPYIGRCTVIPVQDDGNELSSSAWTELHSKVVKDWMSVMDAAYGKMVRPNINVLGNKRGKTTVHLVPRWGKTMDYHGCKFESNKDSVHKNYQSCEYAGDKVTDEIKTTLKTEFDKKDTVQSWDKNKLKEFENWTLALHEHQSPYIGRCIVLAKGGSKKADKDDNKDDIIPKDVSEASGKALAELEIIISEWKAAVEKIVGQSPTGTSVSMLGNKRKALTAHLVPRYGEKGVVFENQYFAEANPKSNYASSHAASEEITQKIRAEMKTYFK